MLSSKTKKATTVAKNALTVSQQPQYYFQSYKNSVEKYP
jgi:hypothetical protein